MAERRIKKLDCELWRGLEVAPIRSCGGFNRQRVYALQDSAALSVFEHCEETDVASMFRCCA